MGMFKDIVFIDFGGELTILQESWKLTYTLLWPLYFVKYTYTKGSLIGFLHSIA